LRPVALTALQKIGDGLNRPEGVIVSRDGRAFASDRDSSVALIRPDGTLKRMGAANGVPAGLAMDKQGRVLVANYGVEANAPGGVLRVNVDSGQVETLVSTLDNAPLVAPCALALAADSALYVTQTTAGTAAKHSSRFAGMGDGVVFRQDVRGATAALVQTLKEPKGCCFDAGENHLFVVQSKTGTVLRCQRRPDGTLGEAKPYGPQIGVIPSEPVTEVMLAGMNPRERSRLGFGHGCAFDQEGNLWVTLIHANRVVAISANFSVTVLMNDPEGQLINKPTSIAFGGRDMCDVYIGMIGTNHIVKTRSPVPGLPLAHQR
jgi:gluconolactonase